MRIIEIARGHLRIEEDGRLITVRGEAHLRGHGSPDFVIYKSGMQHWDAPDDARRLTADDQRRLINFIEAEFLKRDMRVEFED